jgi:preprotein translocase subunit SecA
MFKQILGKILGEPSERWLRRWASLVEAINRLEPELEALTDAELRAMTDRFRSRIAEAISHHREAYRRAHLAWLVERDPQRRTQLEYEVRQRLSELRQAEEAVLEELLPQAFAAVREASKRTLGLRHYDVQLLGGIALHFGKVAEMKTGEGKTLVATLPLYLNALLGLGAHLVTVNDYLARRDTRWMGPIYHLLGLRVGLLQAGEGNAYLYDPDYTGGKEDFAQLRPVSRKEAYLADITYGTNNEFGFDYLRDNMAFTLEARVQRLERPHRYAIVDEVDNILIDEARTPLIISGPAEEATEEYIRWAQIVRQLRPGDYEIDEKHRTVHLTDSGYDRVEQLIGKPLFDPERPEELTPEQMKMIHHLEQALKAQFLYHRNRDYIVQGRQVVIIDEFTGRLMPDRRWSDGLHQAIEAKEGVPIRPENVTYATITIQNYFRMYEKLAGMTGTAATEAEEFQKIYGLDVVVIPTHRPMIRIDHPDVIYRTKEAKHRAILREIVRMHTLGRPVLVGTTSVEASDYLSKRLQGEGLRWLALVDLVKDALRRGETGSKGEFSEEERALLGQPPEQLPLGKLRSWARNLGLDPDPMAPANLERLAALWGVEDIDRLRRVLERGIPHEVLNARHHDREARIIAQAGRVGAVTIATNMAGRGVDIKLGGELPEEVLGDVNRVLRRAGFNPYEMTFEERAEALRRLDPSQYGLYGEAVRRFLEHIEGERTVKALGGLHIIGTERHEARRIDNQLRGRAGRQGDPGSSRFYLSLEDDLLRRFAGDRLRRFMERVWEDEDEPLEHPWLNKTIEEAQRRVEGYNFDIRKHLLEYDDVLNRQRELIYSQRLRLLLRDDLHDDLWAMVEAEVDRRLRQMKPGEGWKVIEWLDSIQPPMVLGDGRFLPSFGLALLLERLKPDGEVPAEAMALLQEAARAAAAHWAEAAARAVQAVADRSHQALSDWVETAERAFEDWLQESQESGQAPSLRSLLERVRELTGLDIRLEGMRAARPEEVRAALTEAVREAGHRTLRMQAMAAAARRVGIGFTLNEADLLESSWEELAEIIREGVQAEAQARLEAHLREAEGLLTERLNGQRDATTLAQALWEAQFTRQTAFDARTHQRVTYAQVVFPLSYLAGRLFEEIPEAERGPRILEHLHGVLEAREEELGRTTWASVADQRPVDLEEAARLSLQAWLGEARWEAVAEVPFRQWDPALQEEALRFFGRRAFSAAARHLLLSLIGQLWVEYLTAIENLRQGIGLEAFGQRDPLVEYKRRAFEMFQDLLNNIRAETVRRLFLIVPAGQALARERRSAPGARARVQAEPASRAIGRNDPCPCGSGKKYKHCHGRPGAPPLPGTAPSTRSTSEPRRR